MKRETVAQRRSGQMLLGVIILLFVASAITAGTLLYVRHEQRMSLASGAWLDALHVAESGIETAINEFYKNVSGVVPWVGWSNVTVNARIKMLPEQMLDSAQASNGVARSFSTWVDLDQHLIIATGVVSTVRMTNAVQRVVEVRLSPDYTSPFQSAMLAKGYIRHGGNASVDSFDSEDPSKSTDGMYDPAKRQHNGDIVTISNDPDAAVFATGNGTLYGDIIAGIGGGVTISGNYTNTGVVGSGADVDISDVIIPMPSTEETHPAIRISAGHDHRTIEVDGHTDMSVSYIRMTGGRLTIKGSGRLRLYVDGETRVSGSSIFEMISDPPEANLQVEIYANGDVLLNSCLNETGKAANLGIYGTENSRNIQYTGDTDFTGFIYAPYAEFSFSGQGSLIGAVVADEINVTGTGNFHYDEALSRMAVPFVLGYRIQHWAEL